MNVVARCACTALICLSSSAYAQVNDVQVAELANTSELSRAAFVTAVLRVNPSIKVARETLRAARARARQAGAVDDPMIEGAIAPLSFGSHRFGFEVSVKQTLPWFGKRDLERKTVEVEASASEHDLESTRRELASLAVVFYSDYFVALKSLEINARHQDLLNAARTLTTAQVEAGRGSVQDVLQAEIEIVQLERAALELATARDLATAQMNQLLNCDPASALLPPAEALDGGDGSHEIGEAKELATEAIRARSEIASARSQARAYALRADLAGQEYFPSITLMTSYNSMWEMSQHRWMVGAGINVPLPNERRAGAIDEARAHQARYESDIERMSVAVQAEVYTAVRRLNESEQILRLYNDRLLPLARQRVDAAQAGWVDARSTIASVIDAQRDLRTLELEHTLARAERSRRGAELERVLGRVPGLGATRKTP